LKMWDTKHFGYLTLKEPLLERGAQVNTIFAQSC